MHFNPIKTLLHKETSQVVKNNVLVICQIAFLLVFMIAYNIYDGNYAATFPDFPIVLIAFAVWWKLKHHDTYYPHLIFMFLLPILAWTGSNSIDEFGVAGAFWSFPIIVLFYFCLPERLAWVSSAVVLTTFLVSAALNYPTGTVIRLAIALTMVSICCVMIFRSLYRQNKRFEEMAHTDKLTGAYNRALLQTSLEDAIHSNQSHHRKSDVFPCIFCVDADHFKRINDTYGHDMGDAALIELAAVLSQRFNHSKDKLFRMGGEEFLVLKHFDSKEAIQTYAESLLKQVEALSLFPDGQSMTVSIGVATLHDYISQTQTNLTALSEQDLTNHSASKKLLIKQWTRWIKQADDAMYQAKATGRNRVVFAQTLS